MIEKLYTVEEVAQLASVTGRTIRNYLKSGRLVGRKIGGQWRFPESEVQRLLSGGGAGAGEQELFEDVPPAYEPEQAYSGGHTYPAEHSYTPGAEHSYSPEPPYNEPAAPSYSPHAPVNEGHPQAAPVNQPVLQPTAPSHLYTTQNSGAGASAPASAQGYSQPNVQQHSASAQTAPLSPLPAEGASHAPYSAEPRRPISSNPASNPASPVPSTHNPLGGQPQQNGQTSYTPTIPAPSGAVPPTSAGALGATYNTAPAPLPTDTGVPPAPGQLSGNAYTEFPGAYGTEPYTEGGEPAYGQPVGHTQEADTLYAPEQEYTLEPPAAPEPEAEPPRETGEPALSDTGMKVLQFIAEVHDCSAGPQTCSVIEVIHNLATAQATITQLAALAAQESANGIPCECYVEYDERFSVARYTLLGSAMYLAQALQLIA